MRDVDAPGGSEAIRWLIDGMNVIGSRPDGWWRDRDAAMHDLVRRLAVFHVDTQQEVTVVFDKRPTSALQSDVINNVDVAFASAAGRDAADHEIVKRVSADQDPVTLHVVTSDMLLGERVRRYGAETVGSRAFRHRLDAFPDSEA